MNHALVTISAALLAVATGLPGGAGAASGRVPAESAPATVEDRGADCAVPALPDYDDLAAIPRLPDPFLSMDGRRVTQRRDWTCRREEIAAEVQQYELGPKPARPRHVAGSLDGDTLRVSVDDGGPAIEFDVTIRRPGGDGGPWPAMIVLGRGTGLDEDDTISGLGVATILFDNGEIAEQQNGESRGRGKFYELYPDHPAGAMMAWAWGVSRLVDALETTRQANIDPARLGVTGCSRNGKGAIVVGAFDERIALTISQESGAGGSSLWRLADVHQKAWLEGGRQPENGAVQTLAQIVTENVWFRDSFRRFATTATRLPFDQHMVMGLIAPRALLVVNNTDMYWLDRQGSQFGAEVAHEIWSALGVPDAMGATQRGGHPHCREVPKQQLGIVAAFVRRYLVGDGTPTGEVLSTDGDFPAIRDQWVDWATPRLTP
jgi:(4-O-methyl)-D-glucuronate---lignin esterase